MSNKSKIPCTVGILTWNSEKTLRRCLESVKDFAEIIVADGGSTDRTLEIAREYGAVVMEQSEQGKVIEDFSLERNRQLEKATQPWFFYLDSDELATPELVEEIRRVTTAKKPEHLFWEIRFRITNPDQSKWYAQWKPLYQVRLWNIATGARMASPIHEKVRYDKEKYSTGRIEAPWLVPIDPHIPFSVMHHKVKRNMQFIDHYESRNPFNLLYQMWVGVSSIAKRCVRIVVLRMRHPWRECVPLRFEVFSVYDTLYGMWRYARQYVRNITSTT